MNLFNALLAKSMGGGGYPEPTGTKYIYNNGEVDVKDYASAYVSVAVINKVEAMIQNDTGFALNAVKCMDASGKCVSDSVVISAGHGRNVYYPVRSNAQMYVSVAPVVSFIISENAQGQVPQLSVSTNKGGVAYVVQREYESNGSYFVVGAVIADVPSGDRRAHV